MVLQNLGIINHSKSLALEVSKYKININTISPGMLKGPMLSKYSKNISIGIIYEKITNTTSSRNWKIH